MNDSFTIGPPGITYAQYRRICDLFHDMGDINPVSRLRRLSKLIGWQLTDYGELTAEDADRAILGLEKEAKGVR